MDTTHLPTITQMAEFVSGSNPLVWKCNDRAEAYDYTSRLLRSVSYQQRSRQDKGIIRSYLVRATGYSQAQVTRLVTRYVQTGTLQSGERTQPTFQQKYTREDVAELARIDEIHDGLGGAATAAILRREYQRFDNAACLRLQNISVSHLYRLRQSPTYRNSRTYFTKTKPATVSIGERTKPRTGGKPGFLRVDSVHQGDKAGEKGVYHVNLVDEATQWEVVVAVEGLSERFMLPTLEAALNLFPFVIRNFHSDNGSEYINRKVAALLERLLVKLTKSRPRHSGDNGLAETKNGAIIRKALGYTHIPRTPDNVAAMNRWYAAWFVPYLNFHRPCAYRETTVNPETGKRTHRYPNEDYQTPYDKLQSLDEARQYLKPGISFGLLDHQAYAMSDTQWGAAMQTEKVGMWKSLTL